MLLAGEEDEARPPHLLFQFLLGCYIREELLEAIGEETAFNSFWDATAGASTSLSASTGLSIPFGMLPRRTRAEILKVYYPFNSFWDATSSNKERIYKKALETFNSFWDATRGLCGPGRRLGRSFNSFWDATGFLAE